MHHRALIITPLILLAACVSLPEGTGVTIAPDSPTTTDDLVATLEGDVGDADKVSWALTWTRDGDDAGISGETVPASDTAKGQVWTVSAVATAGNKVSEPITAEVTIGNTAPVGDSASLAPSAPTTSDDIVATVAGSDIDGDTLTWTYAWTANGTDLGETSDRLPADATAKGDAIVVTATPNDGETDGTPVSSDPLTVVNTPPLAPTVVLTPLDPLVLDSLVCAIDTAGSDIDGDPLTYDMAWTVDRTDWTGTTATTNVDGDTILDSDTSPGQVWACTATANDGEADSPPSVRSNTVTVTEPTALIPGDTRVEMTYGGWSVRCQEWSGNVCTRIQQRVECGTCSSYAHCGQWHDTTTFNNSGNRTALNFCAIATGGDATVVSTTSGGEASTPQACGWSASDHPICESGRASLHVPEVGIDDDLGLLLNPEYCGSDDELIGVECVW